MSTRVHGVLIAACLLLGSCNTPPASAEPPRSTPTAAVATTPSPCPITRQPDVPFVPPAPYPAKQPPRYVDQFWYGTPELWTMLSTDGIWNALPQTATGYTNKVFWWREGYSMDAEPTPQLTITARRLDAPAPSVSEADATNASADFGQAMLIGIDLPTLGCWEVTGHYHGHDLSFVVNVTP